MGVPAAVAVISREDIRRSGVSTVTEALRLVPGVQVSRINANAWAVSARGFAGRLANKLRVLVDGRSIYTPTFSGVHWEALDLVLEDIERIEVVRGPGGALWGTNAVNGVINIITRDARDTRGTLVSTGGGSRTEGAATVRVGGGTADSAWRVYAKALREQGFDRDGGLTAPGETRRRQIGFRTDRDLGDRASWRLQGDWYDFDLEEVIDTPSFSAPWVEPTTYANRIHGGNLLAEATIERHGLWKLRGWYDDAGRESGFFNDHRRSFELDLQHGFTRGRHDLMWGVGWRRTLAEIEDTPFIQYHGRGQHNLWTAFVQDRFSIADDRLGFDLGLRAEDHPFNPVDWQPSARAAWTPTPARTTWASFTRAVRSPAAMDRSVGGIFDIVPPNENSGGLPLVVQALPGGHAVGSEVLLATELGHRQQFGSDWQVDLALFHHDYRDIATYTLLEPVVRLDGPYLEQPVRRANGIEGVAAGAELGLAWQALTAWRMRLQYSLTSLDLEAQDTAAPVYAGDLRRAEGNTPRHVAQWISWFDLGPRFELDTVVTVYGRNHAQEIAPWVRWDARVGWHLAPGLEMSVVGRNLLRGHHREWTGLLNETPKAPGRTVYVGLTWRRSGS